ncbi:terpene synthase 10-like isoform X1 [Zingiber officinale]|uniref:terpene synthase 10-like isoform X1 n=1 Tax=Zingiber officinale TaxID=94328 RepID=UPI001C4B64F5|nr:terpene synthase 10-like isoform X1 [Zingiber officinale]
MSPSLVAPSYIPFHLKLCDLRRSTTTERPCFPLIHCTASRQSPALGKSTHYRPNSWSNDYIQSLTVKSPVEEKDRTRRIVLLKEIIRKVICEKKEVEEQLRLIDHLQQLGVAYHFKDDIKDALASIHASLEDIISLQQKDTDVHVTALLFRLFRENGFSITDDIFKSFRDGNGQFFEFSVEGMLSLHETAFYGTEEEVILQEAMDFTTRNLRNLLDQGSITEPGLKQKVSYALELPLNWRLERLHARWFIQFCSQSNKDECSMINPVLLEFAKLDFNRVQHTHKKELSKLSRWWADLGLAQRLPFFRDRLMANYLWTVGCAFEPEYWSFREIETQANCFIALLDDVYDVYGKLEELEIFTDAIERWDVNAVDKLPDYLRLCFLAVFNTANEAAYRVLKEKGFNVLPYLRRSWSDLCKAFLLEAKWSHEKYTPTVEEYLENGWISGSGHIFLTLAYCMSPYLTKTDLENFRTYTQFLQWSSMNFRLCNDLVEMGRSDGPSAIHCLMQEKDVLEAEAREMIKEMIMANWRAMNGDRVNYTNMFEENFKICAINLNRTAQFFYRGTDRYSEYDSEIKDSVVSLLVEPIYIRTLYRFT